MSSKLEPNTNLTDIDYFMELQYHIIETSITTKKKQLNCVDEKKSPVLCHVPVPRRQSKLKAHSHDSVLNPSVMDLEQYVHT